MTFLLFKKFLYSFEIDIHVRKVLFNVRELSFFSQKINFLFRAKQTFILFNDYFRDI